jgi:SAM-dependent methyltransferase
MASGGWQRADRERPVSGAIRPPDHGARGEPDMRTTSIADPRPPIYYRLLAIKRRLPEWLRYRLDPYNTEADRFVASAGAALPPNACVLDAGAGECRHAPLFAHTRYFGTDNGHGDVEAHPYGRLAFVSDMIALPVRADRMDAVISVNVLEHVAEPARVLAECRRVLRPGGTLYLVAPQSWRLHEVPQDFLRFTKYGLAHLLDQAGFTVVRIQAIGGAFWNLGLRSLLLLTHFKGLMMPLAFLLAPILGVLVPLVCFYLDRLDRDHEDTLGYTVVAKKSG